MTEHVLLESEPREVPGAQSAHKVHARIDIESRLRRRALQLEIIDYFYLVVRLHRSHSCVAEYVLDLQFVDPYPRLSRRIASRWMLATFILTALAIGIAARIGSSAAPGNWIAVCAIVSSMAVAAALVCVYRTTETVALYSVHGQAKLLEFTSGLGAFRAVKPFMVKVVAHIKVAVRARRPSRAQHLRDEMREHFRLRQTGVLPAQEYESSKGRILAAHSRSASIQ
jgi:hypothetical protein